MEKKIRKVIEKDIRPYLKGHGGDIEIREIKGNKITVKLTGACSGCPGAKITIENIVEETLKEKIGEIEVELESGISEEMFSFAKEILAKRSKGKV